VETTNSRDLNTCTICMQSYDDVGYEMGDWLKCHCGQWLHELYRTGSDVVE